MTIEKENHQGDNDQRSEETKKKEAARSGTLSREGRSLAVRRGK